MKKVDLDSIDLSLLNQFSLCLKSDRFISSILSQSQILTLISTLKSNTYCFYSQSHLTFLQQVDQLEDKQVQLHIQTCRMSQHLSLCSFNDLRRFRAFQQTISMIYGIVQLIPPINPLQNIDIWRSQRFIRQFPDFIQALKSIDVNVTPMRTYYDLNKSCQLAQERVLQLKDHQSGKSLYHLYEWGIGLRKCWRINRKIKWLKTKIQKIRKSGYGNKQKIKKQLSAAVTKEIMNMKQEGFGEKERQLAIEIWKTVQIKYH